MAAQTTYLIFVKYADPRSVGQKPEMKAFVDNFYAKYSKTILEAHLRILFTRKGNFVGTATLNHAIQYVSVATCVAESMEVLKPYIATLLTSTILPILEISDNEIKTFEELPLQYIQNLCNANETVFSSRTQC